MSLHSSNVKASIGTQKRKFLIADDSRVGRMRIKSIANDNFGGSLDIRESEDGALAMRSIVNFLPNLLTLDRKMPKMDGDEVLQRLQNFLAVNSIIESIRDQIASSDVEKFKNPFVELENLYLVLHKLFSEVFLDHQEIKKMDNWKDRITQIAEKAPTFSSMKVYLDSFSDFISEFETIVTETYRAVKQLRIAVVTSDILIDESILPQDDVGIFHHDPILISKTSTHFESDIIRFIGGED